MIHYLSQLANGLVRKNNSVFVVLPKRTVRNDYFDEDISQLYVPLSTKVSINWLRFNSLIKVIKKLDPDIIHITTEHPSIIPTLFILKKNYPSIVTIHDVKPHVGSLDFFHFLRLILRQQVNEIIVHGERLKDDLMKHCKLPNSKIAVIPHGDYSFFTKYKKDNVEEKSTILFFGRIKRYKGLEYLIRAEPVITKDFSDIKIIIAGKGNFPEYKKIKNNANFEVFNEFIPDEKVAELFQKAKVVVLPYIEASQSGIIPIAYAFKKPVVATNVGAIQEVVEQGKTGFLVPQRDEKALADAIIKLLKDDNLRKKMGENAYIKMKEELSWDKISEKTIEIYKEAIIEHKR
jgi:glycosyltransferase involved in cell wall biosynthesis